MGCAVQSDTNANTGSAYDEVRHLLDKRLRSGLMMDALSWFTVTAIGLAVVVGAIIAVDEPPVVAALGGALVGTGAYRAAMMTHRIRRHDAEQRARRDAPPEKAIRFGLNQSLKQLLGDRFLLFSKEHRAWWTADGGYTRDRREAGVQSIEDLESMDIAACGLSPDWRVEDLLQEAAGRRAVKGRWRVRGRPHA